MRIIENLGKIKEDVLKTGGLKKTFNELLLDTESIRGSMRLSKIFEMIGNDLQKNKINSIVCVLGDKRNEMIVRNINFPEFEKVFTTKNIKCAEFIRLSRYQEVVESKQTIFCEKRVGELKKIFKKNKALLNDVGESNSIISPLLIKGEIIGTLELISPMLEKKDLDVVDDFVKRLVVSITNNILFYEIGESEKRYKNLFQNSSDGLVFFNLKENKFKESNPAMSKISGYANDELKRLPYLDLFLPEDRKRFEKLILSIKNNRIPENLPIKFCAKIITKTKEIKICDMEIGSHSDWEEIYFSFQDVTSQRNIEAALRDSEEKYRKLVDNAEDGVIMYDLNGKVTFVNSAMANIIEGNKEDIIGKNVLSFISPEDYNMVSRRFKDRVVGKSVISNYDFRIISLKGNKKYINYSGAIIEKKGKKIGIQAIIRDISKNKESDEVIINTKRHYFSIIDSITDDILVISKDYKIVSVNSSFARNIGLRYQSVRGQSCKEVMKRYKNGALNSQSFDEDCKEDCAFLDVFEQGKPSYFIERGMVGDKPIYLGVGIFPIKSNEKTYQAVITIRDVTDSKKAEEENLRLTEFNKKILDSSPVSILVLDKTGKVILINGMAKTIFGEKMNKNLGKQIVDLAGIKDDKDLKKKYNLLLEKGVSFYYDNLLYKLNKNDKNRYLNIIAVPLYDKDKNVDGAISMAMDNTEKVIAEQKMVNLNIELEQKVKRRTKQLDTINKELSKVLELKSKFISDASHELRTPLTVIQGNLDLAKQETRDCLDGLPEAFTLIEKEVQQMTSILADLTMLTNTDASNETINYDKVDINLLSSAVFQTLKVLAGQKNIKFTFVSDDDNIEMIGDETKLEKLLLNIVRNAIKYTEENGSIQIRAQKSEDKVKMIVKDTGIGIPDSDLPYIFERFYRVDKARSRSEGGTGLGLSICKWIAEAHGGTIHVDSKLGKGSIFTVELPIDCRQYQSKKKDMFLK